MDSQTPSLPAPCRNFSGYLRLAHSAVLCREVAMDFRRSTGLRCAVHRPRNGSYRGRSPKTVAARTAALKPPSLPIPRPLQQETADNSRRRPSPPTSCAAGQTVTVVSTRWPTWSRRCGRSLVRWSAPCFATRATGSAAEAWWLRRRLMCRRGRLRRDRGRGRGGSAARGAADRPPASGVAPTTARISWSQQPLRSRVLHRLRWRVHISPGSVHTHDNGFFTRGAHSCSGTR
jgi:hypothetical protein